MPSIPISFDGMLNATDPNTPRLSNEFSTIISTKLGLSLIEIQGDLLLPRDKPQGLSEEEIKLFSTTKVPDIFTSGRKSAFHNDILELVKFGRLEIDESNKSATLLISTTQRLIGKIEKIDPPLGILKIIHRKGNKDTNITNSGEETDSNKHGIEAEKEAEKEAEEDSDKCQMIDLIECKIIFKQRPLPIM